MKIGILGAGAYGGALGGVLRKKGYEVVFYDPYKFPERRLTETVEEAEMLILASPAEAVEKLIGRFQNEWFEKSLIVATKGVLGEGMYEQFRHFEVMSGPGFASEIRRGRKVRLTVGCEGVEMETREGISGDTLTETIFRNTNVEFDRTNDVRGVRLLGALKNIFAIEAGRRGLTAEMDARGRLKGEFRDFIEEAVRESKETLLYNGGFVETVELAAGRGDLILTCASEESRNYSFGSLLRAEKMRRTGVFKLRKYLSKTTVEGIFAAREVGRAGVFIPREAEVLREVLGRLEKIKVS